MGTWTLLFDTTEKPLAEWGLRGGVLTEQSLTMGSFTASLPGNMLGTLPWSYEDTITLKLDGAVKWKGVALSPRRHGAGGSEMIQLRFADPWYYLTQGQYTQPWYRPAVSLATQLANVALFANVTPGSGWEKWTIGQNVADIISQANLYFGGGVMQIGELVGDGFAAKPIPQRASNATYEAVLRQCLAWAPDAIQQWDFSTTPPSLSFIQRASATARTYSFADGQVMMEQEFLKRDDLVVRGIEITYLGKDEAGNVTQIVDQAGETTGTRLLKTTIDCGGTAGGAAPVTPQTIPGKSRDYKVVSEAISKDDPEWWFKYGDTGAASAADITVGTSSIQFAPNAPENAGHTALDGCTLHWLSGGIPKTKLAENARVALVTGYLTVSTTTTEESSANPITTTTTKERRIVKMLVPVTKLNGEYTQVISGGYTIANGTVGLMMSGIFTTPGVAAVLLAAWNTAQYDGSIRIVKSECDEAVQMGDVINVSGGLAEWADMRTQVQGITREIDTGTTTITTGTAVHLGLDEYINQIRMNRMRNVVPASDIGQQATGEPVNEEPSPEGLDDMVGPGSIKYSVKNDDQLLEVIRTDARFLIDLKDPAQSSMQVADTESGDVVKLTPGASTTTNPTSGKTVKTTPDKIEITDSSSGHSITLSIENGLQIYGDGKEIQLSLDGGLTITKDGQTTQVDLLKVLVDDGAGQSTEISDVQVKVTDSSNVSTLAAESLTVNASGGAASVLSPAHLLLAEAGGQTNNISGTQMQIEESGTSGVYGVNSVTLTDSIRTAALGTESLTLHRDSYTAGVGAELGFQHSDGSKISKLDAYTGVSLSGSGGSVTITPVASKTITLQTTDVCDEDDAGEPVTAQSYILRSPAEIITP